MTNPNDAVGTNAAFDGRTSVKAFNDIAGCFSSAGILSGWECAPDSGMFVVLGGNGTTRDVALAENNTGDKTTINNRSGQPIQLEIAAAPATDSRIDAIVAYVTTPPTGVSTVADNPSTVGLIDVVGVEDPSPVAPDDNAIRTAISADGGSGATAYYVILAYVTVANGTTDITNNMISAGPSATFGTTNSIGTSNIQNGAVTSEKVDSSALVYTGNYAFTGGTGVTVLDSSYALKRYNNCTLTIRFSVTSTSAGDHPLGTFSSNFPLPSAITSLGINQLILSVGYLGTTPILGFMHADSRQIDFRVLSSSQISTLTYGAITFNYICDW